MLNIIVGGFYGDEGKGKVVGYLSLKDNFDYIVRAGGGPQAGHTVTNGIKVTQIPSGLVNKNSRLLIARGTIINPDIVLSEIKKYGVENRIGIDCGCTIIDPEHLELEKELVQRIGSVGTGTGPARVDRLLRKGKLAKDIYTLKPYLTDVSREVNDALKNNKKVLVEGVQGYGLSLLNYKFYPYVTSQDTTSSQFLADTGVGPKFVDEIFITYKAYVSRVGKGQMNEWSEEEKLKYGIREYGTVSSRPRRLGNFDIDLAIDSLIGNTATQGAITNIDRLFKGNDNARDFNKLTKEAQDFINKINEKLKKESRFFIGITLISTGSNLEEMIDLR
ncbi:MAG: adenylosuccinate synthetase [Nanoarchaeota archaeon]